MLEVFDSQSAHDDPTFRKTWEARFSTVERFRDAINDARNARNSRSTWQATQL
jgi:hypothetical protein